MLQYARINERCGETGYFDQVAEADAAPDIAKSILYAVAVD